LIEWAKSAWTWFSTHLNSYLGEWAIAAHGMYESHQV
jgi:hypothetical protein